MRFLFTTIQFEESEFYGRVGHELAALGHESGHVTISRLASRRFPRGQPALHLGGLMRDCGPGGTNLESEASRIEDQYGLPTLRTAWWPDPACEGKPEGWCLERTVRTFRAVERAFDRLRPDIVVPEVGSETMRTAAHLVALERGIKVFFLFFTIFPKPLRLYVDRFDGQIVDTAQVRALSPAERQEVGEWAARFTSTGKPILAHRVARVTAPKLRDLARHVAVKTLVERDNEYLTPRRYVTNTIVHRTRGVALRRLYQRLEPGRPFVYFPLHVTDDFKIKKVIPHCVDQGYLIEQVADALPAGYDLVLKEHPVSIGRNPLLWLRRVLRRPNIRLVDPYTSSHELIAEAAAVTVISSTVGLEALLHGKPVLTLGQPYYAGYGVTVDVDSFREIRSAVSRVMSSPPDPERTLRFLGAAMRSTYLGAPQGVDSSPENASKLAHTLDLAARRHSKGALEPAVA
ncbi:MAG: hypothetical protein WKF96_14565 [Solirubrobacteraceae bacterium]